MGSERRGDQRSRWEEGSEGSGKRVAGRRRRVTVAGDWRRSRSGSSSSGGGGSSSRSLAPREARTDARLSRWCLRVGPSSQEATGTQGGRMAGARMARGWRGFERRGTTEQEARDARGARVAQQEQRRSKDGAPAAVQPLKRRPDGGSSNCRLSLPVCVRASASAPPSSCHRRASPPHALLASRSSRIPSRPFASTRSLRHCCCRSDRCTGSPPDSDSLTLTLASVPRETTHQGREREGRGKAIIVPFISRWNASAVLREKARERERCAE